MPGNSFGHLFKVTTFGESHGPAIGVVVDGIEPGKKISVSKIQKALDRRRPGQNSKIGTARQEKDQVEVLSGIFENRTTGTPLTCVIFNGDQRSKDYSKIKDNYRPGHADLTYDLKYGIRDYRGGGRSSGRETAARVIAGNIATQMLPSRTKIYGYTKQIGPYTIKKISLSDIEKNAVRGADSQVAAQMTKYIENIKKKGDSVGGTVEIIVKNPPIGLGEPVFDKLEADLAKALMSIGAVKGVEFGDGFAITTLKGSEANDKLVWPLSKMKTNHAGGTLGGISSGQDLIIRIAVKPTSSILKQQTTIDKKHHKTNISVEGRHDACIVPRLIPVAESMVAITLYDHYLRQKAVS